MNDPERKAIDNKREIFRSMLAGMKEDAVLRLEKKFEAEAYQLTDLIGRGEVELEHKLELLSDIADRLEYLGKITPENVYKYFEA